jgi:hypothetical protein
MIQFSLADIVQAVEVLVGERELANSMVPSGERTR